MTTQTTQTGTVTPATLFEIAEAQYRQTQAAVNALTSATSAEERDQITGIFLDAVTAIDATPVSTLEEFARSFIIAVDDGESLPSEATLDRLFADARRLTNKDA